MQACTIFLYDLYMYKPAKQLSTLIASKKVKNIHTHILNKKAVNKPDWLIQYTSHTFYYR